MKLRNYSFAALALVLMGGSSCSSTGVADKGTDKVEYQKTLPAEALSLIDDWKAEIDTVIVVGDDDSYNVFLKNGIEVNFDDLGGWRKVNLHKKQAPDYVLALLPKKALPFLDGKGNTEYIKQIARSRKNRYTVSFSDKEADMHFSRTGKFLPNDAKRLPSNLTSVLNRYFADDSVLSATVDADFEYSIDLKSGIYLEYDRMGRFERIEAPKGHDLPANFLSSMPEMMMRYMAKSYPDKTIRRIVRKSYGYYVKTNKPESVGVCFSKNGDYLRNANKDEDSPEENQ